ncbi:MAG: metallophosphoesterase family protein [Candidatus Brocadiaceae bacterium]|jgi:putative phosphoesterase
MIILISDIHGNLEALQSVLSRIEARDTVYCAGDIVGYGPNPNECCEELRRRGIPAVMGNHDFVCANYDRFEGEHQEFPPEEQDLCRQIYSQKNSVAQASSRWTNVVLTDENKEYLRDLPLKLEVEGMTIVHGKPGSEEDMLNEYVLPGFGIEGLGRKVEGQMLVVGHSHLPMRTTHVINPGSIGQPRDRNWMASYATLDPVRFKFKYIRDEDMSFRIVSQVVNIQRVPYDIGKTIQKIKDEQDLPDSLGDRLTVGL